jgi:hypothetical protein
MASSQTTAGRRGNAAWASNDSGHTRPEESSQGSRILGSKAERHNKRGLARLTSGSKKQWQDGGEEGAVEQRKKTGGLGLMQGKQSSTTPSPAGPAPIPRWRLDHGRLRLGRQRPWLGLLRLRSGHARGTTTRTCGFDLLHEWHSPSDSSPSLPPPSLILVRRQMDWGKSPKAVADQGETGGQDGIGDL